MNRKMLMIGVFLVTIMLLSGIAFSDTPQSCTSYDWSPSDWDDLDVDKDGDEATVSNWVYWDTDSMAEFKDLEAYYQFEIRRDEEVWDYWRNNCPTNCIGYYWTNLPDPTSTWSEEDDPPYCCITTSGDEEFEIKSEDWEALEAEKWYGGYAYFLRDSGEYGDPVHVHTKSEYCGTLPYCDFGQTFGWCTMTSDDETA